MVVNPVLAVVNRLLPPLPNEQWHIYLRVKSYTREFVETEEVLFWGQSAAAKGCVLYLRSEKKYHLEHHV